MYDCGTTCGQCERRPPMTHDAQVQLFLAILSAHRGLSRAISVADMAGRLQVSMRQAQQIKRLAVDQGLCVGSSCWRGRSGWYLPDSDEEVRMTTNQYKARIRSLAVLIKNTEGAAGFKQFVGELALEFEKEEVSV